MVSCSHERQKIYLIRHAESEANVQMEEFTVKHDNIYKITDKGKQQAQDLVEVLGEPKRIIVSKFIRTFETASR